MSIVRKTQGMIAYAGVLLVALAGACDSQEAKPRAVVLTPIDEYTSVDKVTGTIYIKDLPGSIGNTHASGHIPVFFNLKNHAIINPHSEEGKLLELAEDERKGLGWDVGFTSIYNSYITMNNGQVEGNPAYGGEGKGALIVLDALFDELDEAPTDEAFATFMANQTSTGWEDFPAGSKGWYFYSLQSHIMSAISGVTLVMKTADGKCAKIEMKSVYLGTPENPTVNTPAPYFNFRYFLQADGSRNLSTR